MRRRELAFLTGLARPGCLVSGPQGQKLGGTDVMVRRASQRGCYVTQRKVGAGRKYCSFSLCNMPFS